MDEAVLKYYRKLLKSGFEQAGSIENPSIFLETHGAGGVCGHAADYMHIFINVSNGRIDTMKYLCACDPPANVAVEILCTLAKGRRLDEVQAITEDTLLQAVGSEGEDMRKRARSLLELLNKGLTEYEVKMSQNGLHSTQI